jgi:hypothetical protein
MSSDTPTDKAILLNESIILLTSTTVAAVLYTFSISLYVLCARLFYFQARDLDGKIKHRTVYAFILASVVMACATIDVVCLNLESRLAFVVNSSLPGGPSGDEAQQRAAIIQSVDLVVTLVEQVLIMGVLVGLHSSLVSHFFSFSCLVMACLGCLEWNSSCHTHHYLSSIAVSGFRR